MELVQDALMERESHLCLYNIWNIRKYITIAKAYQLSHMHVFLKHMMYIILLFLKANQLSVAGIDEKLSQYLKDLNGINN